jgi:hypothetical protein
MRRGVERFAPACHCQARWSEHMAITRSELARELQELISALDRRIPRVEQAGEAAIAADAAALRATAVRRLADLAADTSADTEKFKRLVN